MQDAIGDAGVQAGKPSDEDMVMAAVTDLLHELYPHSHMPPAKLDSRLDRDLGIDSLGLVELIDHLGHLFGVDLPTSVMASAETPHDLLDALRRAPSRLGAPTTGDLRTGQASSGARAPDAATLHPPADQRAHLAPDAHPAPGEITTLVEALEWHARTHPDRCHMRLLGEAYTRQPQHPGSGESSLGDLAYGEMSYRELYEQARGVAHILSGYGVGAGDRVALMLPTSDEYFSVFMGILLAGGVPVPIYPPSRPSQLEEHLRRQVGILANAAVSVLVTLPEARHMALLVRAQVPSMKKVAIARDLLTTRSDTASTGTRPTGQATPESRAPAGGGGGVGRRDLGADLGLGRDPVRPRPGDIALLQYTSGSTDNPKGVVLTHANLVANMEAMVSAARIDTSDVVVSWLPLYHDMGLIGTWLSSLYYGMVLTVMTPQAFLTRPSLWLWAIHHHGGTVSAAPNFAYELCTRRIDDADIQGLDLSSWRIALNGAEPVSPRTLERFAERFARHGFKPEAITPVYGLAEAGLGLAFPPMGRGILVDVIDQDSFTRARHAVPARNGTAPTLEFASCGLALPGYEIRIAGSTGEVLPERREGRIEFRGPSATTGYFHNPEATAELYDGIWLDTGDLGYFADGELFVTGRIKDLVIRAGQNLHPEGLEEAIGELPNVRKGCVAVFGVTDPRAGTERLVVIAESHATDPATLDELRAGIVRISTDLIGGPPDEIVIAPPGTVRKTSSGKIRRGATRDLYQRGELAATHRSVAWQLVRFTSLGVLPSLKRALHATSRLSYAGYAWILLGILGTPTLIAVALMPGQRRRRAVAYAAARALVRMTGTLLDAEGLEHLRIAGPFVVVANHASYLDSFALAAVVPDTVTFVAGEVFATKALTGFFLRRLGVEFVERTRRTSTRSDTSKLADLARRGASLVFFPEGGLSRAPGLRRFHQGAFVVAATAGCPVVPVAIRGTRAMVHPGSRLVHRGRIHVAVGAPIYPEGSDWHAAVALGHQAREVISLHCGEPDLA